MDLPHDPFMLLSFVNMKLRDEYRDLDELCAAAGIARDELVKRLAEAGFEYMPEINQFRCWSAVIILSSSTMRSGLPWSILTAPSW